MTKPNFDTKNKIPGLLKKSEVFIRYHLRQLLWRIQDIFEESENKYSCISAPNDDIENNNSLIKDWKENGFIILKPAVSSEIIDLVNTEITKVRAYLESKGQGKADTLGRTGRIVNIHSNSRIAFKFICDQRVRSFLKSIFNAEPVLFSSGTFEVGTEQSPHADGDFTFRPSGSFATAWTALEDIHLDSGPAYYYEKSHLDYLRIDDVLCRHPKLKQRVQAFRLKNTKVLNEADWELAREVEDTYKKELASYLNSSDRKKIPILIKKGETIIWDHWLVHGGLTRLDPKRTRKSIARHYFSKDGKHYPAHDFCLNSDRLPTILPKSLPIKYSQDGLFLRHFYAEIYDYN